MKKLLIVDKGANIQLSPNFNSSEFDCQCSHSDCTYTLVSEDHLKFLQAKREEIGKPFKITSGFRCQRHNKDVGGADKSQHPRGTATDLQVRGLTPKELADKMEDADGLGRYNSFTHVDSRGSRARWGKN